MKTINTFFALLLVAFLFSSSVFAQVDVTATGGTTSASYGTLKGAFDAINVGTHTNVITIALSGSTTETASAVLNASGSGSASYTSINIAPSGGVARTISGAIAGHLIDLNGADNVIIDGLNTGGNSLTIDNTTSDTTSTTIRFIADARNNTITNCTIRGATTSNTRGTIFFSTGTATGNTGNVISNNTITSSGANFPTNAILSIGTDLTINNSGITVSGNNISDYFSASLVSVGINVSVASSAWTITNNRLFQTATRIYTTSNFHHAIRIVTGAGYTVTGNVIGFADASGTGTTNMIGMTSGSLGGTFPSSYTAGGTANATRYTAIRILTTAGGAVSSIQGNTIGGFALYTSSGATAATGIWCGISVEAGNVNVGTITGNTIGATTGNGSIYAATTTSGGQVVGIYATSANTVNIQNNTFGAIDAVGTTVSNTGGFTGIDLAGIGNFTVSNNTIGSTTADNIRTGYTLLAGNLSNAGVLTSSTGAASVLLGIRSAATGNTLSITNNTLRGLATSGTVTAVTGITSSGAMTGTTPSAIIDNNFLGTAALGWIRYAFANSGTLTGISLTNTVATTHSIQSNDFRGITYTVPGTHSHTYINLTGATAASNIATIANNTFTNLNVNTTGSVTFISHNYTIATSGQCIINNNSIATGFTRTAAGAITITSTNSSSGTGSINNYTNNNFSNITVPDNASSPILGFNNTDGGTGSTKQITGNTFNNWHGGTIGTTGTSSTINCMNFTYWNGVSTLSNNTITNITGRSTVTGITIGSTANNATSIAVSGNAINGLSSIGTGGSVTGITTANTSVLINIFKNKIYDLSTSSATLLVTGIQATGSGTNLNIYNNLIGDLRAPTSAATDAIRGINITSTATSSTINVYYNTVLLSATSTGTNFGTSGIFHTASATATTATLNLRNNIIVNNSTAAGSGLTVAYRRSGTALVNYASTSNNNNFFAPTIMHDGTTAYTISTYKTLVAPRDVASFAENPTFQSTTGSSADFLKVNLTTPTQIESGAAPISGITDDYWGTTRNATTPDVGAFEGDMTLMDLTGPSISYSTLGNVIVAGARTFSNVTITDPSVVNTTAGTRPRVYYKKTTDGNDGTGWKFVEASGGGGSPFSFTIDYTLLNDGSVTEGNTIQYFVVAQDLSPAVNVGINSGVFNARQTSVALQSDAFPITGTINSFNIVASISGVVTVGTAGTYPTLTGAGGLFADINAKVVTGNITVNIISDITEGGVNAINQWAEEPANSNFTITIQPSDAAMRTISGSFAGGLIRLNGADRVTIDGRFSGAGNFLTFSNTSTSSSAVFMLISLGAGQGATNNTIRNCNISTGTSSIATYGIHLGGSTIASSGADNDNNSILNNVITVASHGIYAFGTASSSSGGLDNLTISGNSVTCNTSVQSIGIRLSNMLNSTVSQNTLDIRQSAPNAPVAISLETGVNNTTVSGNLVTRSAYTGVSGYGGRGIVVGTGMASSNITLVNNVIYGVTGDNHSSFSNSSSMGIAIGVSGSTGTLTTTTGGVNIYSNSVHMYNTYTKATACLTAAIYIGSGASNLNIRNNVFANKMDNLENTTSKSYAIYSAAGASAFSNINYNDYFASGPEGVLGFLTSDRADLTEWRTATGQDVNSIAANPMFTSDTDLRPGVGSPVLASGTPISGITTDYLGVTRNATNPTIGAYETGVDFSGPAISYTALGNTSSTANRTLSSVTITDVSGVDFGSNKPRIYFKKSTSDNVFGGNTSTDNGWKWTEANTGSSPTDFTIDYSKLLGGSVSIGDTVQFFVVAQDLAGTPYVSSSPSTGFAGISVSSITSAPTTPNQYKIVGVPLAGDYTVGLGFFKSISGLDIEFNQVVEKKFKDVFVENTNLQIEKGINKEDVNRELVSIKEIGTPPEVKTGLNLSGTYELREVEEVTWIPMLNGQVYEGPLYVKKSENPGLQFPEGIEGVYATITAAIADLNERGVSGPTSFTLVNAAYPTETYPITIDVTNENVPSATNTVTIRPASGLGVTVSGSSAVALFRLNGADFIRIDGLNTGGSSLTLVNANAGTSSAVIWIGSKSSTNGATNNIVRNCTIVGNAPTTTLAGIVSSSGTTVGSVAEAPNSNNTYQNNIIRKSSFGIAVVGPTGNETGLLINGNTIGSTVGSDKIGFNGIAVFQQQNAVISNNTIMGVVTATSSTTAGIRVAGTANGILINANSISDVKNTNTGGFSAIGISLNSSSIPANVSVTNNLIWDVAGHGWETFITDNGYGINILSGGGYNLYFNSVNLATNQTLTTGLPACLIINSVVTTANTLDIRNNIFSIPATVGTNRYAVISNAANTVFSNLDNNVYFTSGTNLGYSGGTNRANLTAWRTWSVRDVNSIAANPMFTAEANLQPLTGSPLALAGTAISGITTDITGITRHATTPTIGAFEALASASASNNIPAGNTSPVSFPGTGTTIQFTVGNTGSVDLTIAVIHSGPGGTLPSGLVNIAPQYWAATVTSGTVTGTYSLTLDITGVPGVGNAATLRLLKRDNASSSWVNLGVPTTISGNLLTWAGLTSFSDFGLGGESENPLPVELSTFAAVVKKRDVLLTWETQTEMNAHSFEVQRSLQEGIWSKVGEVMAHGNSNSPKQYSLSDTKLNSGQYSYRLKMIDNDGVYEYSKVVAAEISNPKEYALSQNYPNPFNPSTKIEYQLPFDANVTIELYGITGEKIADLIKTEQAAGFYTLDVNGNSLNLTSGVYIYRMVATGKTDPKAFVSVKKMLMLK